MGSGRGRRKNSPRPRSSQLAATMGRHLASNPTLLERAAALEMAENQTSFVIPHDQTRTKMNKIVEAAKEAVAIARGEVAAPRITINGHSYVPEMVATYANDCVYEAKRQIEHLQRDCAELYQVIGTMADHCPDPEAPQIIKALDNASAAAAGAARPHDDLLPFVLPERRS